ncbi:putative membrane protein [Sphaerotilus hippei]|uniref:Putative membrane protein n=1 Tax=Sphaerotilus hippei TaxID=744406 RepID=A0A318H5J4_9BURK|nr:DUF2061 domain-containing protein [Sphaerotilus hippei]PXW99235.1 putative membrane protein [Sphaerotilus hippei]
MAKSATFGVMHVGIAFGVSYSLTGNWQMAGAITIAEPIVNTVAHYFFDRWWEGRQDAQSSQDGTSPDPVALPA